ncbi:Cmx/CmrA family chloramphenicol efflux MFS transporter [Xenorhabdus bovienii]|uniref:Putative transporter n=1 Tax=Xenorhabdus bovienii str. Intermedium TaxID=1379677 RepID=A0A077QKH0_XENBV|nr:Cmx/CmrA family chloramphenicol efflux MFS transporter [Xenorhabdus bovienii]MDE9454271.1 MFS transporter [Xenorhabdus bovienii]CDH33740.1 putative transporter [Xenorhabdus bovienii str. Intermedium]
MSILSAMQSKIPIAVYLLGLSLFAMGSSEFLIAGVLPKIAEDLQVSLPSAGMLISAFAVGVLFGAPPLAIATLRWPRRATLLVSQVLFVAATAIGMLSSDYWPLLIARVVSGVAYAGFWAVAATTAVNLVTQDRTARALAVVVSGLSLAMVVGGPLGTVISDIAGWRAGFWAVAAATSVTAVALWFMLPDIQPNQGKGSVLQTELKAMAQPRLWVAYTTTILTTAAYMATFGYLGALLIDTSKLVVAWVPAVLALFGIGAFIGLTVGGRTADKYPFNTLIMGTFGIVVTSIGLAFWAESVIATICLVFLLGVSGFVVNPAVMNRVYTIAANAPTLAGATNVSAFQLGITLAPLLAGFAIGAGYGLPSVGWVGALLAIMALVPILIDARLHDKKD